MDIMLKRALNEFLRVLKGQRDSSSITELERAFKTRRSIFIGSDLMTLIQCSLTDLIAI